MASLQYGRQMEPAAREAFQLLSGHDVFELGLVVRVGQGWLAASPDGIFKDNTGELCLLEIKCPFSCRDSVINVGYITGGELNQSHPYYCQIQIQLYCCDLKVCHLFLYSSVDQVHIIVERNEEYL